MGHPVYIHNKESASALAEHYFRCSIEISQQVESDRFFNTLNHALLAFIYLKKGQMSEALTIAEEAFHDALAQGGVLAPICELLLSSILLETGDHLQARERLEDSAALINKLEIEVSPGKGNGTVLGTFTYHRPDEHRENEMGNDTMLSTIPSIKQRDFGFRQEALDRETMANCLFRIQMFGPIRVFHQEDEIDSSSWRTVKSRHLLAYFAHQDKPVSTDQILEDLWPDLHPDRASALFHTTLYYLRRLLQQFSDREMIIRGSKRYQLRPGSILTDRFQFEETARAALGKVITKTLARELEATIQLYRGDYLQDLDYQWVLPVQEEMKNLYTELKQQLASYYLQNKMYVRSLLHIKQLMSLKPYSEEILQLLLTNYAAMGDQSAVKNQYTAFTEIMAEELGLQPSSELVGFYKKICII